jgi:hypothetical protein
VESVIKLLIDKLPVATLMAYAAVVVCVVAYLNGDITVTEALVGLGVTSFGAGKLGQARNEAGRGLRKP